MRLAGERLPAGRGRSTWRGQAIGGTGLLWLVGGCEGRKQKSGGEAWEYWDEELWYADGGTLGSLLMAGAGSARQDGHVSRRLASGSEIET